MKKKKVIVLSVFSLIFSLCLWGKRIYQKWLNQPIIISNTDEIVYDDICYKILDLNITDSYYEKMAQNENKFYIVTVRITNNSEYNYNTFCDTWMMKAVDLSEQNPFFKDNSVGAAPELPENHRIIEPGLSYNDEIAFQLPMKIEDIKLNFYENGVISNGPSFIFDFE